MAPLITPDFSEVADMGPLPAGNYKVRVTGAEIKTSQSSGNHYVNWKLTTFGAERPELNNRVIFHSTPIAGKGAGILKAFMQAAVGEVPSAQFDTDQLMGRELQVSIVEGRDQQGNVSDYPRVKAVSKLH